MKLSRADAIKLAEAVEQIAPELATWLRDAASKYRYVIVTVT